MDGNAGWTTSARVVLRQVPSLGSQRHQTKSAGAYQIYRHPSCLIKHRWEHTPHWREASKFVLSKHQQVQLLEVSHQNTIFIFKLRDH